MTVHEPIEVSRRWTRHYRVDGEYGTEDFHPRKAANLGAAADLAQILPHAQTVGVDATISPIPAVQQQIAKAQRWERLADETLGPAQQELVEARVRALAVERPTVADLNAYLSVRERLRPWSLYEPMNVERAYPGRERRVVVAAKELGRFELAKASDTLLAATDGLYSAFASKAAEAVRAVSAVLPLPPKAWGAADPNAVLADEPRNVLHRSEQIFNLCHYVALWLRAMGTPDTDDALLQTEASYKGLTFKNWSVADTNFHELRGKPKMLRLAFVIESDWQPGLWRASDLRNLDESPARRRFLSFLGR